MEPSNFPTPSDGSRQNTWIRLPHVLMAVKPTSSLVSLWAPWTVRVSIFPRLPRLPLLLLAALAANRSRRLPQASLLRLLLCRLPLLRILMRLSMWLLWHCLTKYLTNRLLLLLNLVLRSRSLDLSMSLSTSLSLSLRACPLALLRYVGALLLLLQSARTFRTIWRLPMPLIM